MGLFGNIAKGIATEVAKNVAEEAALKTASVAAVALDKPMKKLSESSKKKHDEKVKKAFEVEPGMKALIINQRKYTWKSRFDVYDDLDNVRYSVVGDMLSAKHLFRIYDTNQNQVACVKENLLSMRLSLSPIKDPDPYDFDFYIGDKKVAHMKTQSVLKGSAFVLDNGWQAKGKLIPWDYTIIKNGKEVARIQPKILLMYGDTYLITMPKKENELLVLMVALAIDIMQSPTKGEELKSTARQKILHKY